MKIILKPIEKIEYNQKTNFINEDLNKLKKEYEKGGAPVV